MLLGLVECYKGAIEVILTLSDVTKVISRLSGVTRAGRVLLGCNLSEKEWY